jgi:replicative DNA helicase
MSAAATRRRPLELVPEPAGEDTTAEWLTDRGEDNLDVEDWQVQSVARSWEPEHQLIGALMWLSAEQAKPILELVPDTAIFRPPNLWAYEIIRSLVDQGRNPDPVVVLARARARACSLAIDPAAPPSPARHHQFALHLAAAYTQTVSPAAAASYAREVLDEAYRRAFRTNGIRMQQLGECGADRESITEQFAMIRDELADLWRRAEAAAKPGW